MRNGLLRVGIIAAVALGVGCAGGGQQPGSPATPSTLSAATAPGAPDGGVQSVPRNVNGVLDGRFDFTHTWGDAWWQFYSDSDVVGTVTHLGLTRMHTRHIPDLVTGAFQQGEFTIVAANGDEIRGTYEGSASYDNVRPDLAHGAASFVVSGGTGRFAHAIGTLTATFLETFDDPSWSSAKVTWTLAGTVSY